MTVLEFGNHPNCAAPAYKLFLIFFSPQARVLSVKYSQETRRIHFYSKD